MNNKTIDFKPLKIVATPGHIKTLAEASAVKALCELIWNGFDASSQVVSVKFNINAIDGLETITVEDRGEIGRAHV